MEIRKGGKVTIKALSKSSTLSGRSRHFREAAGAVSWDKREGSTTIKAFIEDIVKPVLNSTLGSRDLTKNEVKQLRLMNCGTKPERAKQGTSQKSKEKYLALIRKAASLISPTVVTQEELEIEDEEMNLAKGNDHLEPTDQDWSMDYSHTYDDLYDVSDDYFADDPIPSIEDVKDEVMVAEVDDTTPRRFVFCCIQAPFLQTMTEQQALTHPLVNMSDPRNQIPKLHVEVVAIRDALQETVDHFKEMLDYEPVTYEGSNYISEYCNIQDQVDVIFRENATSLRRLGRWEGEIFDWEQANVEDDPCIGRMTQFFF